MGALNAMQRWRASTRIPDLLHSRSGLSLPLQNSCNHHISPPGLTGLAICSCLFAPQDSPRHQTRRGSVGSRWRGSGPAAARRLFRVAGWGGGRANGGRKGGPVEAVRRPKTGKSSFQQATLQRTKRGGTMWIGDVALPAPPTCMCAPKMLASLHPPVHGYWMTRSGAPGSRGGCI